jgi:predicted DNA binding CopG/RHH family protein
LNQAVDSVIFKIIGAQNKTLSTSKPRPNTYCSDLVVDDLPNGNYKLTVEIKGASGLTTKTVDIEIKKTDVSDKAAQLQQLVQTATAIVKDKCSQAGAQSLDQCKNSLIDTYIKDVKCQNLSQEECTAYLKNTYSETVVIAENKYERIKAKASEIIGKEMQAGNLENIINEGATANISVPLKDKEIKVKAINAVENIILDKAQGLIQTAPMAITIDSDGDGIPDDIEKRIGTDPLKADSDSDGYNDSEEILKGYDPLGPGKKEIKLSPIEKAIINNQTLEHPKTSGTERESFTVDKVENVSDTNANDQNGNETTDQTKNSNGYMISGKAEPSSVATIYIYSDIPIVTTVTTDEYGNWEYHFDQSLTDGEHEVYIAINDNTGKVISKSKPFGFGIAQAQAISPQDLVIAKQDGRKAVSDNMLNFYLIFALGSILFGILIFLFAILKQKNKLKP